MKLIKMNRRLLMVMCLICFATFGFSQTEFITVWKTDNPSGIGNITTTNSQIKLPLGNRNYNVSWVKVDEPSINSNGTKQVTGSNTVLTFPSPGEYEVRLTTVNSAQAFLFTFSGSTDSTDCRKLINVKQWGTLTKWDNVSNIFRNCALMDVTATDKPTLSRAISNMFQGCESLIGNPSFNTWDMSAVTNFSNLFNGATVFNQPIGDWNTSAVTNMTNMFSAAAKFNQPIGDWNTSAVTNMNSMFNSAVEFNQPLVTDGNKWNISNVTNMNGMFNGAKAFNQSLGSWKLNQSVTTTNFLNNSNIDCSNYQATLAGWAENLPELTVANTLNVTGRKYYGVPSVTNRETIAAKKWILSGDTEDGAACGLPVTFSEIKASLFNNTDLLVEWKTSIEKDNDHFIIWISKDGEKWSELDNVASKAIDGNSATVLEYAYTTNINSLQLAEVSLVFSLFLAVLLFNRRKCLFISMALLTGLFFTNCSKSEDIDVEDLYIKITQVDKYNTTSDSKIALVMRVK